MFERSRRAALGAALVVSCAVAVAAPLAQAWGATKKPHAPPATAAPAPPATPKTAKEWFEEGSTHHRLGEYEAAAKAYTEAMKLEPHPVYLYNLAAVHRLAGNA